MRIGSRCLVICAFIVALIGLVATAQSHEPTPDQLGGEIVIIYGGGQPRHLNSALLSGTSTGMISSQIFASPLRYDGAWNPLPYLARSWEVSEDGLSVTLHLVEGAVFHDGIPITSQDVAFSVRAVQEHHPFQSMFAPVERVDTPDEHTAVLRLSQPHPAILLAMSPVLLPIIPEHIYGDGQELATHPANLTPTGSGPFKLLEWIDGESITLERNESFFISGRPYLDRIVVRYDADPAAQALDLERQEAHLTALYVDLDGLDRLSQLTHLRVTELGDEALGPTNWLSFNLLRPPLDDVRVRQAIAYAIDCDFIVDYMHRGRSPRADSPISPASPFYDDGWEDYAVDLEEAVRLLEEAGLPRDEDGVRLHLTLDYIPLLPTQQRDVAHYVRQQLALVGIDVAIRHSESFGEWASYVGPWNFDMTLDIVYNWGDPAIGVHRTYECSNIRQGVLWSNTQNYCNPEVDALLAQALVETDPDQRASLYADFQQIVIRDVPVLWINLVPYHTVYHEGLVNPPLSIWGVHSPLDELYWSETPDRGFQPAPILSPSEQGTLKDVGSQAIELIQQLGLTEASKTLGDPANGFVDLTGTGLHVLGLTRGGSVFLDTSGQFSKGMTIASLKDLAGKSVHDQLVLIANGNGFGQLERAFAHPTTFALGTIAVWCGWLSEDDLVCVLEWVANEL